MLKNLFPCWHCTPLLLCAPPAPAPAPAPLVLRSFTAVLLAVPLAIAFANPFLAALWFFTISILFVLDLALKPATADALGVLVKKHLQPRYREYGRHRKVRRWVLQKQACAAGISAYSKIDLSHSTRDLAYKNQLYRARHLLHSVLDSKSLVIHSEPFEQKLAAVVASGEETSAFYAINVTNVIKRLAEFQSRASRLVQGEIRLRSTADSTLNRLIAGLNVVLRVESVSEVGLMQHMIRGYSFSTNDFILSSMTSDECCTSSPLIWDSCVVRPPSHIAASLRAGVRVFLIDHVDEVFQIREAFQRLRLSGSLRFVVLIEAFSNTTTTATTALYGCSIKSIQRLASQLEGMQAEVVGICVRCCSDEQDAGALPQALKRAGEAVHMLQARSHVVKLIFLHGCLSENESSFSTSMAAIREFQTRYCIARVICDVTRFIFEGSHTLVTRVIGQKPAYDSVGNTRCQQYVVDNGTYGSFARSCIPSDVISGATYTRRLESVPRVIYTSSREAVSSTEISTIWGQTCDSIDCVLKEASLPKLTNSSWLTFSNMDEGCGAYETRFNGFEPPKRIYFLCVSGSETCQ